MIFVFWANLATKNRVFLILYKKEYFLDQSPWFWSKNRTFYHVCVWGNKKMNFDILNKKECLLDQKWSFQKNPKNRLFPKVHCFCQKNRTFYQLCFLGKSSQKRSFFDILDKKECFLDRKRNFSKVQKNRIFPKGLVHGFCRKIELFIIFVFLQIKPDKIAS